MWSTYISLLTPLEQGGSCHTYKSQQISKHRYNDEKGEDQRLITSTESARSRICSIGGTPTAPAAAADDVEKEIPD